MGWYFTNYAEFPTIEKRALKFARGRVLDVGCGAGRHALYLQRKGLRVTAMDSSLRVAAMAAAQGVQDVRVAKLCEPLPFGRGEFQTVLFFGNNLGICGTLTRVRRMLGELGRVTTQDGRILATTRMLDATQEGQRVYMIRNLELGRPIGQVRMRLESGRERGNWFDLLLFALTDLMQLAALTGWVVAQVFQGRTIEEGYAVVLEKMRDQDLTQSVGDKQRRPDRSGLGLIRFFQDLAGSGFVLGGDKDAELTQAIDDKAEGAKRFILKNGTNARGLKFAANNLRF